MFVGPSRHTMFLGSTDAPYARTPSLSALQQVVSVMCTTECRELGKHLRHLRAFQNVKKQRIAEKKGEELMTTWIPRGAVALRLMALADGKTVVALPTGVFYADPLFSLSPSCPTNLVFYGQFVVDKDADGLSTPRVLVYDVRDTNERAMHPVARYQELRTKYAKFLPAHSMMVQWVGFYEAAKDVLKREDLPHEVDGLLCLGPDCDTVVIATGLGFFGVEA